MIKLKNVKKYCYEDPSLIENYDKAIADTTQTWECHHRVGTIMNCGKKELIAQGCYENRPAHDLIFLPHGEHSRLHKTGKKLSAKACAKMREANSGKNNPMYGKHHSEETRAKMSAAQKGKPKSAKHRAALCGKRLGWHFWNNGVENRYCKESPGPDWTRGIIKK